MKKEVFKIAFDHQIFQAQKYGGVSRYVVNLAKNLESEVNEVKIIAPLHQNLYLREANYAKNIYFKKILPKTERLLSYINNNIVKFSLNKWKPDIIHQTYYPNKNISFNFNPIIICTIHDMIHEKFPEYFPANNRTVINKKRSILNANHLICVSESTKKDLIDIYNISEEKISVIYHGFEFNISNYESNDFLKKNRPYLLYVGNRDGYKNFLFLIKSISFSQKIMNDFNIIAFGGGEFNDIELLTFKKLGFKANQLIQITGDDSILKILYQNATAFIYPSLYEGFGIPPLEAMANNCPVISSNSSSISEVIGNAGKYFDPTISEQIIDSIEKVVYSESNRKTLINLGTERIKLFSWKQCAINTDKVYKNAILNR
jgi:glycosyltransferase involved in cell wall biosynthesis